MRTGRSKASQGLLAISAAAGLTMAVAGGSTASAQQEATAAAPAATVSMRFDARGPRFTGSPKVAAGQMLRIRNLSDPKKIGPHTFTLVAANVLPKSRKAMQQCFTPGKICLTAAIAHEFDEQTEEVNKPLVEAAEPGWDRRFSRKVRSGDSWYSEKKGEQFKQVVSAPVGTVLRYMCIIHPEMQGKIKVVG